MDIGLSDSLYFALLDASLIIGTEIMRMPTIHLAEPNEQQTKWSLFLGIAIWLLHLLLLDALISVSCKWSWLTFPIAGLSGLQFVELIISLIALLAMLLLIYLPWRYWQSFQTEKPTSNPQLLQETEEDRRPLLASIAMSLNGLLFLFVIATFVPMFALNACGHA
jgi:hypothetical protein